MSCTYFLTLHIIITNHLFFSLLFNIFVHRLRPKTKNKRICVMPRIEILSNAAANPLGLAYKSFSLKIQNLKRLYFCTSSILFYYLSQTLNYIHNDITLHNILLIKSQIRRNHKIKTNTKYQFFDISKFFCVNSNLFRISHGSNLPKFIGRLCLLSLFSIIEV